MAIDSAGLPNDIYINFTDANGDGQCNLNEPIGFLVVCGIHGQSEYHRDTWDLGIIVLTG
jgi:hypothetical protein